jgi:adenosylcobinamide-phosphate synthase
MQALLAALALIFERLVGYPQALVKIIGHPVIWMGALISLLERRLNQPGDIGNERRRAGIVMLTILLAVTLAITIAIRWALWLIPFGWVIEAILASTLLAQKELGRSVRAVADGLDRSLEEGRRAVSHIVGRDPQTLDAPGVSRAAIESLAESSSDGVVAPAFWLMIFGLPGIAAYKAINTADSMVGHRTDRYFDFGWASAKLDDVVNWIPARLTALLLATSAFFVKGADAEAAWRIALRDARKHDSPNAGWPEAAMAGALGFALGGPRNYDGKVHDLPAFGDGRTDLGVKDIHRALRLYGAMLAIVFVVSLVVAGIVWRVTA